MPHRFVIRKIRRFFIYRVLHVDDTPHRIALGLAAGIFITWTPTIGFQMVLTVLLATLLQGNKFVGVPFVWISNPLTAVPLSYFNFVVGTWILPGTYSRSEFFSSLRGAVQFSGSWLDKVVAWWKATADFLWPLWTGSILVGLVLAVITYVVTRRAVVTYRKRWPMHRRKYESTVVPPVIENKAESRSSNADRESVA